MCLIIHNPKAKDIPFEILDNAMFMNPDGFGIFYHDDGSILHTMSAIEAEKLLDSGRPYTAHFRYATSGPIGKRQCHPFKIDDTYSLMMNGTIERLVSKKQVDTEALCQILSGLPESKMLDILRTYPCRFALLNRKTGEATPVNTDLWSKRNGVLYSKSNCFPEPPPKGGITNLFKGSNKWGACYSYGDDSLDGSTDPMDSWSPVTPAVKETVAVYGTLKAGHGNHHLLEGSHCIGTGITADRYPMVVSSIPFLIDDVGTGHHVHVEVYRVDADTLDALDGLEGHPNWYQRRKKMVKLDKGGTVMAWIYVIPKDKKKAYAVDSTDYVECY